MSGAIDIGFVGGGLANCIAGAALKFLRPDVSFRIYESEPSVGGKHTWCFYESDINGPKPIRDWLHSLTTCSWDGYEVKFPGLIKNLPHKYFCIESEKFANQFHEEFVDVLCLEKKATDLTETTIVFEDDRTQNFGTVIDGRGSPHFSGKDICYQKFLGLKLEMKSPHGLVHPVVMDATVEQRDGFRFIYVLPLSSTRVLIEDTRYSNGSNVDQAEYVSEIENYVKRLGIGAFEVVDREIGVLPIPVLGSTSPSATSSVPLSGMRAGLFHPTTGYSLPEAVKFAAWLSKQPIVGQKNLGESIRKYAVRRWSRQMFYRRLNNMMFYAGGSSTRYKILEQFYGRHERMIARFYRGDLTSIDKLRVVAGKAPVPLINGVKMFFRRVGVSA